MRVDEEEPVTAPRAGTIAFVGLGAMGRRMARRLLGAGHAVVVWNRTAAKALALVEAGARTAASPAEAARGADAVLTMVSDGSALRAVTEGPDGALRGLAAGASMIEMSTVGVAALARLQARAPAGVAVLDAPVLGSVAEAEAGTLRILVGGGEPAVARWWGLLEVLGTPYHVGPAGAGAAAKLLVNAAIFAVLGALGESLAVGRALGLPDGVVFDVLGHTPLAAQAERRRPALESGEYPARFALSLARKDAALVSELATSEGLDLRVVEAARSWLADAEAAGLGAHDYVAVLAHILGREARTGS